MKTTDFRSIWCIIAAVKTRKNIALVYFSRNAARESQEKNWFSGRHTGSNKALASSLIIQSTRIVEATGFPVFHYHEGNQRGRTFGQRIARAYQEVFAQGYDAVIAVGNDSPELATTDWQEIEDQLTAGRCVIGPSLRGGAYLVGLTAEVFHQEKFQHLPWQTHRLFSALTRFCTVREDRPVLLETLRDVNTWHDLQKLVKKSDFAGSFKRILLRLLFRKKKRVTHLFQYLPTLSLAAPLPLRAPPLS